MTLPRALLVAAALAATAPMVRWSDGKLTLHAANVPLASVLRDVARATGIELRGIPVDRPVSADLDAVPLEDALTQLLGRDNFALTYRSDGRVRAIEVLGTAAERNLFPPPAPLGDAPEDPAIVHDREVMTRTVQVHGRVATALGTTNPAVGQLLIAAFRDATSARTDIQRAALQALAHDHEVEATFTKSLLAIDDTVLADILNRWNPDGAKEFLAKLSTDAHSPELRAKATAAGNLLKDAAPPFKRR